MGSLGFQKRGSENATVLATERNVLQTDVNALKTTSNATVGATTACLVQINE